MVDKIAMWPAMCLPASNVASDGRQDEEDESAAAAPKTVGASDAIVVVIEGSSGMEDMEDAPGSAPAAEECEQGENPKFYLHWFDSCQLGQTR